jgi:RNA polymerase sigma-70 factor (ECF subfamily)
MQPSLRRPRRIGQELRPDRPLDYARLSDPIVITRAKSGDARALEELCARHAPRVEALARHLLADPEDARDAAQDALAKLCVKLGQFRGESAFTTWLHRLVANACSDVAVRQRRRRCEPLADDLRADQEPGPAREAELAELRAELREGLDELPEAQARVLVLKDALGFSFTEISAVTDLPVGTAKCYAHRGRAGLRGRLEATAA